MAVITFWNNNTGKIGQTHSAIAIATYMAIEHNHKILLLSTRHNDEVSMQAFGFKKNDKALGSILGNKVKMDLESGINAISKLALSNRLTPEVMPNYTRVIFKQRLEVLSGPTGMDYEKVYSSCKNIVNVAKRYYDIVFVDLNNGLEEEMTREILNISNIIIANIEQKPSELEEIKRLKESNLLSSEKSLLLMNKYDRDSKYSIKNSTRYLNEKSDILSVPYNNIFAEAVQEGTVPELFLNPRIRKLEGTEDKNAFFISELKRASDAIIYKLRELQMKV